MARSSDRTSPEALPALPNLILIVVLTLLLIWGVAGLYLPETAGSQANGQRVRTSDTIEPRTLGDVPIAVSE